MTSPRFFYLYFSLKSNRNFLLKKIENGVNTQKLNIPKDFLKNKQEEDQISKQVLSNWKQLDKKTKLDYCKMIWENSQETQTWAYGKQQELRKTLKSKLNLKNLFSKKGGQE